MAKFWNPLHFIGNICVLLKLRMSKNRDFQENEISTIYVIKTLFIIRMKINYKTYFNKNSHYKGNKLKNCFKTKNHFSL